MPEQHCQVTSATVVSLWIDFSLKRTHKTKHALLLFVSICNQLPLVNYVSQDLCIPLRSSSTNQRKFWQKANMFGDTSTWCNTTTAALQGDIHANSSTFCKCTTILLTIITSLVVVYTFYTTRKSTSKLFKRFFKI